MTDDQRGDGIEWSDAERRALASLETEAAPPPGVENRIVGELARRGVVADRRRPPVFRLRLVAAWAVAALVLFAAGVVVGRSVFPAPSRPSAPAEDTAPRFALFLLDEPPGGLAEEPARVAEYKRWAASLSGGSLVAGEKLGDEARLLVPAGAGSLPAGGEAALRGYFVIRAPDLARALEVARSCPHLKRGGRILVRPIVPV